MSKEELIIEFSNRSKTKSDELLVTVMEYYQKPDLREITKEELQHFYEITVNGKSPA